VEWITSERWVHVTFGVHDVLDADVYAMEWTSLITWDLVEDARLA
jgi:hypothetical protein